MISLKKHNTRSELLLCGILLSLFLNIGLTTEIKLSDSGGVLLVPAKINDSLNVDFVIDSGAADVHLPRNIVDHLEKQGKVTPDDYLTGSTYILADGSKVFNRRFTLRKISIGNIHGLNIVTSIGPAGSTPLLGQGFLKFLPEWKVDNEKKVLVIDSKLLNNPSELLQLAGKAKDSQNYTLALEHLRNAASLGFAPAEYHLGVMYREAKGVEEDPYEAFKWILKSAQQGYEKGEMSISTFYYAGYGTKIDYSEARYWAYSAANKENAVAQNLLGNLLYYGLGGATNKALAIEWWERASNNGSSEARINLRNIRSE